MIDLCILNMHFSPLWRCLITLARLGNTSLTNKTTLDRCLDWMRETSRGGKQICSIQEYLKCFCLALRNVDLRVNDNLFMCLSLWHLNTCCSLHLWYFSSKVILTHTQAHTHIHTHRHTHLIQLLWEQDTVYCNELFITWLRYTTKVSVLIYSLLLWILLKDYFLNFSSHHCPS